MMEFQGEPKSIIETFILLMKLVGLFHVIRNVPPLEEIRCTSPTLPNPRNKTYYYYVQYNYTILRSSIWNNFFFFAFAEGSGNM